MSAKKSEEKIGAYMGWAIVRRVRSPYLWVYGWHDGRRRRESVKSDSLQAARALIRRRVTEIAKRGKLVGPEIERTTYRDVEAILLADVQANRRPSYHASVKRRARHLRKAFGKRMAAEITYAELNRYKVARLKQASPATVRLELVLMGRALRLAVMEGRLEHVPPIPTVSVSNARSGFCSAAEISRVIRHLPEHVAPVVRLLYESGMRSHEALELRWSRVDFEASEIRLRAEDTKTGFARTIPFEPGTALADTLTRQREKVSALERAESRVIAEVFPDVAPITFKRWWLRAVKAAGLPALRPHDTRRSFVRNAVRSGVSEGVVMGLVGHRTRAMLARYDITSAQDLRDGMKRLAQATATLAATRRDGAES